MTAHRVIGWLATLVVAIGVALALPVSQLRLVSVIKECCCPDPQRCHCPDHKPDPAGGPSVRACHNTQHLVVSPEAPAVHAAVAVAAPIPVRTVVAIARVLPAPHPAPAPARPAAPS